VLALGDKRSELPYTAEDRKLMTAVAASAALALEQKLYSESPDPDIAHPTPRTHAVQCVMCGRIQDRPESACRTCGGPVQQALLPAVLAGKFEVEQQIGSGGMGVVYRARDLSLNRLVALKVLPRLGSHAAARLRREARAMAMMQHPNLAIVHAMESWRGAPVLVLEYLSGGTLADRIRQHATLPVTDVVSIGLIVADVLRHVHTAGYLHRDLKPSNIGFTAEESPKLLDFGLVRLVTELADSTTALLSADLMALPASRATVGSQPTLDQTVQQFVGTPAYMSPEAFSMDPADPGVDLWGLAVTLYEGLTGRNPFAGSTLGETVALITRGTAPDVRDVRPDCPPALAAFFASVLTAERNQRPRSAAEFSHRLQAAAINTATA
jgi:serine/threonine-protein kinase